MNMTDSPTYVAGTTIRSDARVIAGGVPSSQKWQNSAIPVQLRETFQILARRELGIFTNFWIWRFA
ncbi:MAG: hypothetical protein ABIT10_07435 [Alteraurantiacibacter sp.]